MLSALSQSMQLSVRSMYVHHISISCWLSLLPVILFKWNYHNTRICNCSISPFWPFLFFFKLQPDILICHRALILLYTSEQKVDFSVLDANTVTPVAFCLHITSRTAQVFMPPHNWSRATCAAHSNSSLLLSTNSVILSCHLKFSWMAGHNFSILLTLSSPVMPYRIMLFICS